MGRGRALTFLALRGMSVRRRLPRSTSTVGSNVALVVDPFTRGAVRGLGGAWRPMVEEGAVWMLWANSIEVYECLNESLMALFGVK